LGAPTAQPRISKIAGRSRIGVMIGGVVAIGYIGRQEAENVYPKRYPEGI
jgi:hypothetical protein